jgi:uncharacterized protein YndB with AHSA1/START domain
MAAPLEAKRPAALRLTRTVAAPREKVFRAWTDPKTLSLWFAPSEKYVTRVPQLEAREGGRYRIEMTLDGRPHRVSGTYREVRFPERLVFTWQWENEPDRSGSFDTVVRIEFHDRGGETELVLTHEGFVTETDREEHDKGWKGCLDRLGPAVA